jgi:NADH:ubiquinone oxidoreductase subunit H
MNRHGAPDPGVQASALPVLIRDWRFYVGIAALILSLILPLFALLVPLLGLSVAESAVVVGFLIAGGPEIIGLVGIALLGRNAFQYFAYRIKHVVRQVVLPKRVSKTRYYVGLTINLASLLPLYIYGYFPTWLPSGDTRIHILAAADVSFILSMFILGGEFWEKFRRLFIWEGKP